MRRILVLATVALSAVALSLGLAASASASDDLAGRWKSASLRDFGGPGYVMRVTSADADPGNAYSAVLRFRYQDGRIGPRVRAGLLQNDSEVWMVLNGKGGFANASNPNIMKGTIGNDGSMFFPTCYKQLKFATKKNADEMCLFQESPTGS
jgi:hypothetical protein